MTEGPAGARPKEFKSDKDSTATVVILTRVKE